MRTMKHWALAAMTAAALALAGCGGGGSPPQAAGPTPMEKQHMAVGEAVEAAKDAVDALDAMSTDAEVMAAQAAIDAARDALNEASLLSGNQVFALGESLSDIEMTLASTETAIADHRKMVADNEQLMKDQRMTADEAIGMANTAVAGLSGTSTDEEVTAAKGAIQDAKDAVTAATSLSDSDRAGLNDRISNIETMLAGTESDIADHRQMVADDNQRMGVSTAIDAAMAAVGDLDAMSTDEDVNAAKALITAAKTALSGATSLLTADAALALRDRISTIETTLVSRETAIASYRKKDAEDKETQRVAAVDMARSAAMASYMKADADAKKADAEATAAEAGSPGSPGAMAARDAATAARTAADAAMEAHDAITDGMTKAEADAEAQKAAKAADDANGEYMTAKMENDDIQNTVAANKERDRKNAVMAAQTAAGAAVMAAETAKENADKAAMDAEDARDAAHADYMKAMAARTDAATAKAEYEKAKAAAMEARDAATAANSAYMMAMTAAEGIDPAGSGEAAQTAQMTAETEQGNAEDAEGEANTEYMTAMTAMGAAKEAAGTHVLSLFMAANGAHVMDGESTMDMDEKADHVEDVGEAMATAANAANGNQAAGTTASASWPGDTVANPDAEPATKLMPGMFSISVNVAGTTSIMSEFRESRADDPATEGVNEAVTQTAMPIVGDLGVFRGYDLWEDDGVANTGDFGDRARAIVFTNKEKGKDSVLARDGGAATSVNGQAVDATELSNVRSTGNTITGVTWKPSDEAPLTGTLTCGDTCSIELGEDGAVTDISGYTFAGSRETVKVVGEADATEDNDYLIFGLWLNEGDDGTGDAFGAFADGGSGYKYTDAVNNAVTGEATYSGHAAGAHHKTGDGVNWFHGDASLTAKFGDDQAAGTISGEISNIRVNGGEAMSAPIYLGQASLGNPTFNGAAFMGAATAPGAPTHEFDGTWSGSFFGPTEEDDETEGVNEKTTTAPLATAGTFGVTKSVTTGTGDDAMTTVESFVGAFGAHKD